MISDGPDSPTHPPASALRMILIAACFVGLALCLRADPLPFENPLSDVSVTPKWSIDPSAVQHPKLKPVIEIAGFTYNCSDCHKLFSSPAVTDRKLTQHQNIELRHGINTRCFNCHNIANRDTFVDDLGGEIPYDQPQLVCAKCHGPVYRDWQHGSHGRSNGYWDQSKGERARLKCVQCHDPHHPPFPPMVPAPGPHTLRMGSPMTDEHPKDISPLRLPSLSTSHRDAAAADKKEGRQ